MILIDSSAFIEWFRNRVDLRPLLEPWIRAKSVAGCGVVRAEVVRGIPDVRQKARIQELFDVLEDIPTDASLWFQVADLAWTLDRRGTVLPLTDLVIAACAQKAGATLVTHDEHFAKIPGLSIRATVPKAP